MQLSTELLALVRKLAPVTMPLLVHMSGLEMCFNRVTSIQVNLSRHYITSFCTNLEPVWYCLPSKDANSAAILSASTICHIK